MAGILNPYGNHNHNPVALPPPQCDDGPCCNPANVNGPCGGLIPCVQVPAAVNVAQPAFSIINNVPHAPGPVFTCPTCLPHDRVNKQNIIDRRIDPGKVVLPPAPPAAIPLGTSLGARANLCSSCTRDEMVLYWKRVGTAQPAAVPGNSLIDAWQWPTAAAGPLSAQDLCKCRRTSVDPWQGNRCHACRNALYHGLRTQHAVRNDKFLRKRTKEVIKGDIQCTLNGGNEPHKGDPAQINNRLQRDIGRRCPCGNVPAAPKANAAHFIDVCLACMGVRVNPANIPAAYRKYKMISNNRPTRGRPAPGPIFLPTKGKRHAQRHQHFRVNIECGWMTDPAAPHAGDPHIGGQ